MVPEQPHGNSSEECCNVPTRRKQSTDPVVHLDGTTLETKPYTDYLRVCIDNQLSWKEQVKKVTGRAYGALRNLRRVKHSLPLHTRKLLYRALYCCPSLSIVQWSGTQVLQFLKLNLKEFRTMQHV